MIDRSPASVLQRLFAIAAVALLLGCGSVMADTPPELPGHVRQDSGAVRIFAYRSNVFIVMDVHGRGTDGLVDQWYVLQTDAPPAIEPVELPVAQVRHREGVVRVTAPGSATVYDFVSTGHDATWPEPAPVTSVRVDGYGLSHNTGPSTMRIGGRNTKSDGITTADEEGCDVCEPHQQDWGSGTSAGGGGTTTTCQSGGNPSVSCSVGGNNGSCSITCPTGYYSCCNPGGLMTMPSCKCYKM